MKLKIPELSLIVLIGATSSGKSTFARKHFKPTEVLSSDFCRGILANDENDQSATKEAFELLHYIAESSRQTHYGKALCQRPHAGGSNRFAARNHSIIKKRGVQNSSCIEAEMES